MKTVKLVREQIIEQPIDQVFGFFSSAQNLEALTPPWLNFEILTPQPIEMHVGTIIQYALRVRGLPVQWTTAISSWRPPYEFVDVQLSGPYALWHHRHTFEARGNSTLVRDEIHYRLPFGWLGSLVHALIVKHDINTIFNYRVKAVAQQFDQPKS